MIIRVDERKIGRDFLQSSLGLIYSRNFQKLTKRCFKNGKDYCVTGVGSKDVLDRYC